MRRNKFAPVPGARAMNPGPAPGARSSGSAAEGRRRRAEPGAQALSPEARGPGTGARGQGLPAIWAQGPGPQKNSVAPMPAGLLQEGIRRHNYLAAATFHESTIADQGICAILLGPNCQQVSPSSTFSEASV